MISNANDQLKKERTQVAGAGRAGGAISSIATTTFRFKLCIRRAYSCTVAIMVMVLLSFQWNMKHLPRLLPREAQEPPVVVRYIKRGAVITSATTGGAPPTFCQHWSPSDAFNRSLQPFDLWHTHHPTWVVTEENDSAFCLAEVGSTNTTQGQYHRPIIRNLLMFYANQFHSSCSLLQKRTMWSSGWSADFWNMQCGLIHALYYHVPFFMEGWEGQPWHYAANKDDHSNLTCSAGDTTCYFLPYHGCTSTWNISTYASMLTLDSNVELLDDALPDHIEESDITDDWGWSAYLFLTRKQLWLRRAVFDHKEHFREANNIATGSECSVIHVRRADVVLHDEDSRRYFPVADYVKMIPEDRLNNANHYILLLTDDSNAIDEAHLFFPNLKWTYLDRPRFRGSSGGWENQTPSRHPASETIFLLAEFELAAACSVFVHGKSGFSNIIYKHMLSANSNVTRYMVEDSNSTVLELTFDQTESHVKSLLEKASIYNQTRIISGPSINDCSDVPTDRIIIVNMLGGLANDLFEVAFAKRLAEQLGCRWDVIYRSFWAPAFPTDRTDECFPNALAKQNNRRDGVATEVRQMNTIKQIEQAANNHEMPESSVRILYQALTYNELEPEKHRQWDNNLVDDRANNMTMEWIESLGGMALRVEHMLYPLHDDNVDQLILKLSDPASPVRAVSLGAFFIHFDWMRDWMFQISNWLHIEPSCCRTPTPSEGMIVIHIRDFEPDDEMNNNLKVGVYRDIIDQYYDGDASDRKVLVVCQPTSINTELVQDLVKEFGAIVRTGEDNIDAFCILASAKSLYIASTSSTFSQMAALLAEQKNEHVQVHYPTHTLDDPPATLYVTSWKYHLTNAQRNGIAEFDVNIQSFSQAEE